MQIISKEDISPEEFREGIFLLRADQLWPVAINGYSYQSLEEVHTGKLIKDISSRWMSNVGIGGVGQYSLRYGPYNFLSKLDLHFRQPTEEELATDFNDYGEQVLGPAVKDINGEEVEKYKNNSLIRVFGEEHYYLGPHRIEKARFITKLFPGQIPTKLDSMIEEIDKLSEISSLITFNGYHLLGADNGELKYGVFGKASDFKATKLRDYGVLTLENEGRKLIYSPPNGNPVDFTPMLKEDH